MATRPTGAEVPRTRHPHPGSFRDRAAVPRRQFLRDGDPPLTTALTEDALAEALAAVGGRPDRIPSPPVTPRVPLGQVLSADHSRRAAVARPNACRVARGRGPCSPHTGAYRQARERPPEAFLSEEGDPAELYRTRWHGGPDPRSLGPTSQVDALRRKTPELVRKGLRTHVPTYDLIRTAMARAATRPEVEPRSIGFEGAARTLEAFRPVIALRGRRDLAPDDLYRHPLDAVGGHRVGDRPGRFGPRRRERRPEPYDRPMKPRREAKRPMLKGVREK